MEQEKVVCYLELEVWLQTLLQRPLINQRSSIFSSTVSQTGTNPGSSGGFNFGTGMAAVSTGISSNSSGGFNFSASTNPPGGF